MEISITLDNQLVYNKSFFTKKEKSKIIDTITKDKRLTKCAIFLIAAINYTTKVHADVETAMAKVDKTGFMLLGILQRIGFWVCIVGCLSEILSGIFKEGKNKREILPLVIKWTGVFGTFHLLPNIFELIRDIFA